MAEVLYAKFISKKHKGINIFFKFITGYSEQTNIDRKISNTPLFNATENAIESDDVARNVAGNT